MEKLLRGTLIALALSVSATAENDEATDTGRWAFACGPSRVSLYFRAWKETYKECADSVKTMAWVQELEEERRQRLVADKTGSYRLAMEEYVRALGITDEKEVETIVNKMYEPKAPTFCQCIKESLPHEKRSK